MFVPPLPHSRFVGPQWFSSIQYTSVAGAVSRWYFTPTMDSNDDGHATKDVSHFLLSDSIVRTLRHHLGTMALGSFITAVVITIKYVAVYVITQIQAQSPENKMCVGSAAGRPIAKA